MSRSTPPPSKPSDVLYWSLTIVDFGGDNKECHDEFTRLELRLPNMPAVLGKDIGERATAMLREIRGGRDMTETTADICTAHKLPETIGVFARFDTNLLTLGVDELGVITPIPISLKPSNGEFIATFYGTTIATQGETPTKAVELLQSIIADFFEIDEEVSADQLGSAMQEQRRVLREHVRRK